MPSKPSPSFPDFKFSTGKGYDFASANGDRIVISSSGGDTVIKVGMSGEDFVIVSESTSEENVLYKGTSNDVLARFQSIKENVFGVEKRVCGHRTWLRLGASVVVIGVMLLAVHAQRFHGYSASPLDAYIEMGGLPQLDPNATPQQRKTFLEALTKRGDLPGLDQNKVPNLSQAMMPTVSAPRAQTKLADGVPVTSGAALNLPSFNPPTQASPPAETASVPTASNVTSDSAPAASTPPAATTAPDAKTVPTASAPADPKASSAADKKPDVTSAVGKPAALADTAAITADVANKLKLSGMTRDDAEKALREISMLSPNQMTGASLDSLPEEVRKLVLSQGMADGIGGTAQKDDTVVEGGIPAKLIALPEPVLDNYRGHDGIASLPENSSWQARGNPSVSLPLPGGGDIKSVEDLKAFGLAP